MRRTLLKSKIHRATVTACDLDYEGSLALGPELLAAADLLPCERVEVYNLANGERFATYVIAGSAAAGEVIVNGAAAHKAKPGDLVIICSYASFEADELREHRPTIVLVDGRNRALEEPTQAGAGRR